ncbi:hypothetical protein L596_029431 [Steinernema carpocapsae]|uniref:Uncharacterized protein n=1 Tax=Steinernema carpocapsae TaxID=34508 RepID=A0A4U5LUL8_STECR|nr:hypothetical protein L596_029431 [Steinernema carpocapsae]
MTIWSRCGAVLLLVLALCSIVDAGVGELDREGALQQMKTMRENEQTFEGMTGYAEETFCKTDQGVQMIYATCNKLQIGNSNISYTKDCTPDKMTVRVTRSVNFLVKYHFAKSTAKTNVTFNIYDKDGKTLIKTLEVNSVCNPAGGYYYNEAIFFGGQHVNVSSVDKLKLTGKSNCTKANYQLDRKTLVRWQTDTTKYGNVISDLVFAGVENLNFHHVVQGKRYSLLLPFSVSGGRDNIVGPTREKPIRCVASATTVNTVLPIAISEPQNEAFGQVKESYTDPQAGKGDGYGISTSCRPGKWYETAWPAALVCVLAGLISTLTLIVILYMCCWRIPRIKRRWAAMDRGYYYDEATGKMKKRRHHHHHHHCPHEETGAPCDCVCNSDCELGTASEHSHTDETGGGSKDSATMSGSRRSKSKTLTRSKDVQGRRWRVCRRRKSGRRSELRPRPQQRPQLRRQPSCVPG